MGDIIYSFIKDHLMTHVLLIALSFSALIVAMFLDGVFGVRKAKEQGIARTSTGFKKTAAKADKYLSPMTVLCLVDLLCSVVIPIPAFTMLWACYCIFCEFVSIREKSWQKAELRKAEQTMNIIIENKDDIAKLAAAMLFNKEDSPTKDEDKEETK